MRIFIQSILLSMCLVATGTVATSETPGVSEQEFEELTSIFNVEDDLVLKYIQEFSIIRNLQEEKEFIGDDAKREGELLLLIHLYNSAINIIASSNYGIENINQQIIRVKGGDGFSNQLNQYKLEIQADMILATNEYDEYLAQLTRYTSIYGSCSEGHDTDSCILLREQTSLFRESAAASITSYQDILKELTREQIFQQDGEAL